MEETQPVSGHDLAIIPTEAKYQDVIEKLVKALTQCHGELWSVHLKYGDYENAKKHSHGLVLADEALGLAEPYRKNVAKPRKFTSYVSDPHPVWISISFEDTACYVMRFSHCSLHLVIGFIELDIEQNQINHVSEFLLDNSVTVDELRSILPLLKQAVYTARSKLPERYRSEV